MGKMTSFQTNKATTKALKTFLKFVALAQGGYRDFAKRCGEWKEVFFLSVFTEISLEFFINKKKLKI